MYIQSAELYMPFHDFIEQCSNQSDLRESSDLIRNMTHKWKKIGIQETMRLNYEWLYRRINYKQWGRQEWQDEEANVLAWDEASWEELVKQNETNKDHRLLSRLEVMTWIQTVRSNEENLDVDYPMTGLKRTKALELEDGRKKKKGNSPWLSKLLLLKSTF